MQLGKALVGAILGAAIGIALLIAVHMQWSIDKNWMAIPVAIITGLGVRALVTTYGHASYLRGAITALIALGAFMFGMNLASKIAVTRAASAKTAALPTVVAPPLEGAGAMETADPTDPVAPADPNATPADPAAPPADATTPVDPATPADPNATQADPAAPAEAARPADDATADATKAAEAPAQPAATPPDTPNQRASDKDKQVRPNPAQQFSPVDFVWLAVAGLVAYQLGRGSDVDPRTERAVVPPPDAT